MTRRRLIAGVLMLALFALAGYAVTQLTVAFEGHRGTSASFPPGYPLEDRLLLSLCVDDEAGGLSDEAVDMVREALEAVLAAEAELPSAHERREVTAGCPAPAVPLGTPTKDRGMHGIEVNVPGDLTVFVYLIDPTLHTATFGDAPYALGEGERVCQGDVCFAVTTALYLPGSVSAELLQTALADSLGLLPPPFQYSDEENYRSCERGEEPYPGFNCSQYEDLFE